MPQVYLAAPIDKVEAAEQRFRMAALGLGKEWEGRDGGLAIYNPLAVWTMSLSIRDDREACRKVARLNETALLTSDLLFLCYKEGVESWGVPMEMKVAYDAKIPMVMWGTDYDREQSIHILPVYAQAYFTDSVICGLDLACSRAVNILAGNRGKHG